MSLQHPTLIKYLWPKMPKSTSIFECCNIFAFFWGSLLLLNPEKLHIYIYNASVKCWHYVIFGSNVFKLLKQNRWVKSATCTSLPSASHFLNDEVTIILNFFFLSLMNHMSQVRVSYAVITNGQCKWLITQKVISHTAD